ncbi:hypothetical protein LPJ73_003797, partial [Coemansia sp. RSA 2703]
KSVMSEFEDNHSSRNAHLHSQSHRALDFGTTQSSSLDQQVKSHVHSYYAGDGKQQQQDQSQQHGINDGNGFNDASGENENQHSSPNSSRYSMSVRNLTSP